MLEYSFIPRFCEQTEAIISVILFVLRTCGGWVGSRKTVEVLKKEEGDGTRKTRKLCLEYCKFNFFP